MYGEEKKLILSWLFVDFFVNFLLTFCWLFVDFFVDFFVDILLTFCWLFCWLFVDFFLDFLSTFLLKFVDFIDCFVDILLTFCWLFCWLFVDYSMILCWLFYVIFLTLCRHLSENLWTLGRYLRIMSRHWDIVQQSLGTWNSNLRWENCEFKKFLGHIRILRILIWDKKIVK